MGKKKLREFKVGDLVKVRGHAGGIGRVVRFEVIGIFPEKGALPVVEYIEGREGSGFVFDVNEMEKLSD